MKAAKTDQEHRTPGIHLQRTADTGQKTAAATAAKTPRTAADQKIKILHPAKTVPDQNTRTDPSSPKKLSRQILRRLPGQLFLQEPSAMHILKEKGV